MTAAANRKVNWDIGIDLDDLKKDFASVGTELKTVTTAINDFAKQADKAATDAAADFKAFSQMLHKDVVDAINAVASAVKPVRDEAKMLGTEIGAVLRDIKRQVDATDKAIRQSGMSESGKLADNYATAIAKAKNQVDELKKSLAAANITDKERLELANKIAEGEANIAKLAQQSVKHVNQLKDAESERSKAVAATGEEMQKAAQDLALMATAAAAVMFKGLGGAAKEFGDFEATMLSFKAVSSATQEELASVSDLAVQLGADSQYTAKEIGTAAVELAKMGFSATETKQAMAAMVEAATASGESLSETSSIVASTLRMFNMQASESGKVADIITRGANISAQSFSSFAESIKYVGSAAAASNQDLVDVAGLLDILADRGIKGSTAGNGLQNAMLKLQAPTAAASDAIKKLNLAIADTHGTASKADDTLRPMLDIIKDIKKSFEKNGTSKIEQAGILKDLFGEVALNTMQVFVNTSNDVLDKTMAKQRQYLGSTKNTADEMKKGLNYAIQEMQGSINSLQISFGKELAPAIIIVADGIKALADAFTALPGPIKMVIADVTALGALILTAFAGAAGISAIVGKGTAAFETLGVATSGVATAVTDAWGVMGPYVTKMLAGFAQIAGVAVLIYEAFKTNFGGLGDILSDFTNFLIGENNEALNQWSEEWNAMWANVGQTFDGVWLGMSDSVVSFLGFMDAAVGTFFKMLAGISRAMRAAADRDWEWFKAEATNASNDAWDLLKMPFTVNDTKVNAWREAAQKKFFTPHKKAVDTTAKMTTTKKVGGVGTGAGDGGDSENDILKQRMDSELKAADQAKTKRETALLNKESNQIEAKSLTDLQGTLARTALAFEENKPGAIAFQKSMQSIGATCAATVTKMLEMSGVTIDFTDIIAKNSQYNENVVYGWSDALVKMGYAVKIAAKDIHAGDLVLAENRRLQSGHIGLAISDTQVVHAGSSAGQKVGLRQLATVDSIQGAFLNRSDVNSAGGEAFGLRFTEKAYKNGVAAKDSQLKIEEDYHKQRLAILAKYQGAYQQAVSKMTTGSKEYVAANKELLDIQGQIATEEKALAKLGVDSAEIRKKAHEDYLKAVQKDLQVVLDDIKTSFTSIKNDASALIKDVTGRVDALREANLKATLNPQQQADYDLQKQRQNFDDLAASYQARMTEIQGAMADFKKHSSLATPEQMKALADLEQEYGQIKVGLEGLKSTMSDFTAENMTKSILDSLAAETSFVDGLRNSESAMQDFLAQTQNYGKATDSMKEHVLAWAKANNFSSAATADLTDAVKAYTLSLRDAASAKQMLAGASGGADAGQTPELTLGFNELSNVADSVFTSIRAIGGAISELNGGLGSAVNQVTDYFGTMFSSIGKMVNGIATGDIGAVISGAFEAFSFNLTNLIHMFTGFWDLVHKIQNDVARMGRATQESAVIDLEDQIRKAESEGKSTENLKMQLAKMKGGLDAQDRVQAFNDKYSSMGISAALTADKRGAQITGQAPTERVAEIKAAALELGNDIRRINGAVEDEVIQLNKSLAQGVADATSKAAESAIASMDKLQAYKDKLAQDDVFQADVESLIDKYAGNDPALRESIRSAAEGIVKDRNQIIDEVKQAYGDNFIGADAELTNRLGKFSADVQARLGKIILDAQKKAQDDADKLAAEEQKKRESDDKAAEDQLRKRAETLKKVRTQLYDKRSDEINQLIKGEQRSLDVIEKQNQAFQDQIKIKEDLRKGDLKQFDAQDKSMFAGLVGGQDIQGEIRSGLADIANPEGTPNGTFSAQSIQEAMKARVELLTLQNENQYKLEEITKDEYLRQQQKIAAIQAGFANEALKAEGLTNRQRLELEQSKADAYVSFQESYRQAINDRFDTEIAGINASIEANNKQADVYKTNIDAYQAQITTLKTSLDADLGEIDTTINDLLAAHDEWALKPEAVLNGVKGPLQEIIDLYQKVHGAIKGSGSSGSGAGQTTSSAANAGLNYAEGTSGQRFMTTSELFAAEATRMATGGPVPTGYPNDTFPALLSSGEFVLTPEMRRSWQIAMAGGANQVSNNFNRPVQINVNGGDEARVLRVVRQALKETDATQARINGHLFGPLN